MNSRNIADSQSNQWQSWLVLFLRWLLGGIAGIGISSWFYFGIVTHANTGSFLWFGEILSSVVAVPFVGLAYLFYPGLISYPSVSDFFVTFPVLIWGLIGALLASGRKEQIKVGVILLVLWVIIGCISFFRLLMYIPT